MNLLEFTCTQVSKNPVAYQQNRCPLRSQSDLIAAQQRNDMTGQNRPLNRSPSRAFVGYYLGNPAAAAVLGVTSARAEGEAGALLQTFAQRRTHQSARRPDAALALHVAHEAESAFGDHLAG